MENVKKMRKEKNQNIKKIFEIREKNHPLTLLLKNKTSCQQLEEYPQEVNYYLAQDKERKRKLQAEKDEIEKEIDGSTGEELAKKLQRKNDLAIRIEEIEKEKQKSIFPKYLSYITNNERL